MFYLASAKPRPFERPDKDSPHKQVFKNLRHVRFTAHISDIGPHLLNVRI